MFENTIFFIFNNKKKVSDCETHLIIFFGEYKVIFQNSYQIVPKIFFGKINQKSQHFFFFWKNKLPFTGSSQYFQS